MSVCIRFMNGFNDIYYKYRKLVRVQVLEHCYDESECDDLVQESWFKISKLFHKYNGDGFPKWSKSIVKNVCLDNYRRKHTLSRTPVALPQWEYDPYYERMRDLLGHSLDVLTPVQQSVIILRIKGLMFKDISDTLGLGFSFTQTSYYIAIRKLKSHIGESDLGI